MIDSDRNPAVDCNGNPESMSTTSHAKNDPIKIPIMKLTAEMAMSRFLLSFLQAKAKNEIQWRARLAWLMNRTTTWSFPEDTSNVIGVKLKNRSRKAKRRGLLPKAPEASSTAEWYHGFLPTDSVSRASISGRAFFSIIWLFELPKLEMHGARMWRVGGSWK